MLVLRITIQGENLVLLVTCSYRIPFEKEKNSLRLSCLLQGPEGDRSIETETWYDLALLYLSLSQWRDAELCISKIKAINSYSPVAYHATGDSDSSYRQLPHSHILALCWYKFILGIYGFDQCRKAT